MKKLNIKSKLRPGKPVFNGFIAFIIGLSITRQFVGIGRFTTNFWFGSFAYILIAISGLVSIKILEYDINSNKNRMFNKKQLQIIEICIISAAIIVTLINILIYVLDILILFIPISIGILWTINIYYLPGELELSDIKKIILSLVFSLGLAYGAGLNTTLTPFYVLTFSLVIFFSEFSRELNKDLLVDRKPERTENKNVQRSLQKSLKVSLIFQLITIALLISSIFLGIASPILYVYLLIPTLIFFGLAAYLSYEGMNANRMYRKINIFLKFGFLFELLAMLLSN